ncbi:hypothetical protein [Thalassomonas haliotis]|uniref:Uncharacterized protein n=1 Tax=Thalassomonas haliotis TaxID=485448 RepID=A0ABY7V6R1_9GAMM|nr:hypothetical protein [Thalassomonas haliotis]WDE09394.1 hypothetical protein H3N35_13710 [Thalassomonas haliotis]
MMDKLNKITPAARTAQRVVRQSDLKRKNYLALAGISDEALVLVNRVLDQADRLFARASLKLNSADKEKLIEINYYIKGLYRQELTENAGCTQLQLKCWYEQRQFLLQAGMSDGQKQLLKAFNRQLRFILDAVRRNFGDQKLNKLFNHLASETGKEQTFAGKNTNNKHGNRFITPAYLPRQPAMLTTSLAS